MRLLLDVGQVKIRLNSRRIFYSTNRTNYLVSAASTLGGSDLITG